MYRTINEFVEEWNNESASTLKLLDVLTDASLGQEVAPGYRTLGRLAWHIVTSLPVSVFGVEAAQNAETVPSSAKEIADSFRKINASINNAVKSKWTDATLTEVHAVFGTKMPLEVSLPIVVKHLIHHRGQMTVLMRQAGLHVPGVMGPSREEWVAIGMEAPSL